jgi:substrate import-associated zinc metallohydrolase lipoprotein
MFDKWLLENYAYPYNIGFKYRMEDIEAPEDYELVPATTKNSIAIAKIIKYMWLEAYDQVADVHFTRAYAPKVIHLIGSPAVRQGSVLLGTAESGMKITLFDVNALDPTTVGESGFVDGITQKCLATMYHEFTHILQNAKMQPIEFNIISNADYIGDDWMDYKDEEVYPLGFISNYARSEAIEDFAEMLSLYVVCGQEEWGHILTLAGTRGANILNQKLELVKSYLKVSWNIDLDELRQIFALRASTLSQIDLLNL